jgi:hypothetical protein
VFEFASRAGSSDAPQNRIGGRKGIGISQRTHRHVLRGRPFNSGNFAQLSQECVAVRNAFKLDLSLTDRSSERIDGFQLLLAEGRRLPDLQRRDSPVLEKDERAFLSRRTTARRLSLTAT